MFTGLIEEIGTIKEVNELNSDIILTVDADIVLDDLKVSDSIAVDGACLTVIDVDVNGFSVGISPETQRKTSFGNIHVGDLVNLERSLRMDGRLGGHFVQGHIDTTSLISQIDHIGKSWLVSFNITKKFRRFLIYKGSIAVNGVSLTIAKITKKGFQISVIPKTLKLTNLIKLKKKDVVNIEFDIVGKYIKSFS